MKKQFTQEEKQQAKEKKQQFLEDFNLFFEMVEEEDKEQLKEVYNISIKELFLFMKKQNIQKYSDNNKLLLFYQSIINDVKITELKTFQGWRKDKRKIIKDSKSLFIFAPILEREEEQEETTKEIIVNEKLKGYKLINVFDKTQTELF